MEQNENCRHFINVFPKVHMDDSIKEMLKEAQISNIRIIKESKSMEIFLLTDTIIHQGVLDGLGFQIKNQFPGISDVSLKAKIPIEKSNKISDLSLPRSCCICIGIISFTPFIIKIQFALGF